MNGSEARNIETFLDLERAFARSIIDNDADRVADFLTDDWIVVGSDGRIVDRIRFLEVIRSGLLTHDRMESSELRVREYGDAAVVTALTSTSGRYRGEPFETRERSTDVFVRHAGAWRCALTQLTAIAIPAGLAPVREHPHR